MGRKILIKVNNEEIFLSPKLSIPTNPSINTDILKFRGEVFWKIELSKFDKKLKKLSARVIDYNCQNLAGFDEQIPKEAIQLIEFEKFHWQKLQPLLYYYHPIRLPEITFKEPIEVIEEGQKAAPVGPLETIEKPIDFVHPYVILDDISIEPSIEVKPTVKYAPVEIVSNLDVEFSISFSEVQFMLGYVSFKKYISQLNLQLDFKIDNDHILPEFDNIKFWFAKKLDCKKKFRVMANIKLIGGVVSETYATSKTISAITPELIDTVKYQRTYALTKSPRVSINKTIFSADETFDHLDTEDKEGNVFKQSEKDILKLLIEKYKVRNRRHLEYLSGSKQSEKYKIRFTLSPIFGFVFFLEGKENNHFIWELLNSHATYIWSIGKGEGEMERQYTRIEKSINAIRDAGRQKYKMAYSENHIDEDLVFNKISHDLVSSKVADDFARWKYKLNECLI